MKQFLKFTVASMLGVLLALIVLFLFFIVVVGLTIAVVEKKESATLQEKSLLHLRFDQEIPDRTPSDPFETIDFDTWLPEKNFGLNDILKNINKARKDKSVKGIFLELSHIPAGICTLEEIRNSLLEFRKDTTKFILCYSDLCTQGAYYLGSVANRFYLQPEGYLEFRGLYYLFPFVKRTLEKLEIEAQVIRHGKYKSAVEPFILDSLSAENREQIEVYLSTAWNHMTEQIARDRGINLRELRMIADSLRAVSARDAVQHRLADELKYKDEVLAELRERLGLSKKDEIPLISLHRYNKVPDPEEKGYVKDKIAVVYAAGTIVEGKGEEDEIGSETISEAIRRARTDDKTKAIVVRVNSGGGSALASDIIWREVALARQKKPVVVSFSNVAASGGYYISCAADTIVSGPSTITGSIGVLGILFNTREFFKNKLGVTFDGVGSSPYADMGSSYRPLTFQEKEIIRREIEKIYGSFVSHVADGRGMTKEAVDSIGQGRIWSGTDAQSIGLVDITGGLDSAIAIAAQLAGLIKYRIAELPEKKPLLQQLLEQFTGESTERMLEARLRTQYPVIKQVMGLKKLNGIQAFCFQCPNFIQP